MQKTTQTVTGHRKGARGPYANHEILSDGRNAWFACAPGDRWPTDEVVPSSAESGHPLHACRSPGVKKLHTARPKADVKPKEPEVKPIHNAAPVVVHEVELLRPHDSLVFQDRHALDFRHLPAKLAGRHEAYAFLASCFAGVADGVGSAASLWGPVGTGKTVLAQRFAADLRAACQARHVPLQVVHVNCRTRRSAGLVMLGILNHFDPHYPDRGFSVGEMLRDLRRHLERRQAHLLVILDEVDALLRDDVNLVYDLTRFNSETTVKGNTVNLLLLSQSNVFHLLDAAGQSTFRHSHVYEMKPYADDDMRTILSERSLQAFRPGACPEELLSEAVSAAHRQRDVRVGLDILLRAGEVGESLHNGKIVAAAIESAIENHAFGHSKAEVQDLPPHCRMILKIIGTKAPLDGKAFTTGEVEKHYRDLCTEQGLEHRAHTQFWKYLRQLREVNLIDSRLSGKGQAGTTQLIRLRPGVAGLL